VIYLDSAALVKLVREEDETGALVTWLNERAGQRLVASVLVDVEVPRALRRSQPGVLGAVSATLARIDRIELDAAVRHCRRLRRSVAALTRRHPPGDRRTTRGLGEGRRRIRHL